MGGCFTDRIGCLRGPGHRRPPRRISRPEELTKALTSAQSGLAARRVEPSKWFATTRYGNIDLDFYREKARDQIKRDREKVQDGVFRERYLSGYAFVRVPRFRHDAEVWREFTESFAGRVLYLARHQSKPRSLFVQSMRKFVKIPEKWEPSDLLARLREPGTWRQVRDETARRSK